MSKRSQAPASTPAAKSETESKAPAVTSAQGADQRNLFFGLVLDMSWQLAIVVIIPTIGGYELDQRFHMSPWLTISGLIIATGGVIGVLTRIVTEANRRTMPKGSAK